MSDHSEASGTTGGEHQEAIRRAMNFPLDDVVNRYKSDHDLPQGVAEEHMRELRRFLALAAVTNEPYGMMGPIDEAWHTFVIFTKPYARFCDEVAGRFLHHFPNVEEPVDPELSRKGLYEGYLKFLRDYEVIFAEEPPLHLWPRPAVGDDGGFAFANCSTIDQGTDCGVSGCTTGDPPD